MSFVAYFVMNLNSDVNSLHVYMSVVPVRVFSSYHIAVLPTHSFRIPVCHHSVSPAPSMLKRWNKSEEQMENVYLALGST